MAVSFHKDSLRLPLGRPPPGWGYRIADTNEPERVRNCMLRCLWAGNIWRDGHRLRENFLYSDWCVIDIDDDYHQYPLAQAIKEFADKIHIIGLTRNHLKDKAGVVCDRYRIAVPWEQRISELEVYEGNMHALSDKIPAMDTSALNGAQPFFRCIEIVSFAADGFRQDVTDARWVDTRSRGLDLQRIVSAKSLDYQMRGRLPAWVEKFLQTGMAEVGKRHFRTLGVAIEMVEHGLSSQEIGARLQKIPISRSYRHGEVNDILRHAFKEVAGRVKNGEEG